ncbi:MAG: hypothetical protein J5J00_05235 [Deltaproteobacteria bacterium]|nr:hypothetical protein [Deltaproteobacteria bacterium]
MKTRLPYSLYLQRLFAVQAIFFIWLIGFSVPVLAENGFRFGPGEEIIGKKSTEALDTEESAAGVTKRRKVFKGFGAYRSRINSMCRYIDQDGQRSWLAEISKTNASKERECSPCRSLYAVISSACADRLFSRRKPAVEAKPPPSEETEVSSEDSDGDVDSAEPGENAASRPTAAPKASERKYDPRLEVLDIASRIFIEAAEDPEFGKENFSAVKHLTDKMLIIDDKELSERYYYDTLAAYILAPFRSRGYLDTAPAAPKPVNAPAPTPTVNVDKLFDF